VAQRAIARMRFSKTHGAFARWSQTAAQLQEERTWQRRLLTRMLRIGQKVAFNQWYDAVAAAVSLRYRWGKCVRRWEATGRAAAFAKWEAVVAERRQGPNPRPLTASTCHVLVKINPIH